MTDASAVHSDPSTSLSTSALSEAPIGPALQMNVLGAARAAAELASYVGVCPTCLAWHDPAALTPEHASAPGRAVCPTCGQSSVEWDLAVAIDDQVEEMRGLVLLDEAVQAEGLAQDEADPSEHATEDAPHDVSHDALQDAPDGAGDDARPGSPSQVPGRGL
ncbi:MAG: hypothetical protein ABI746_11325 [Dermatophilaceae bacterium]